MTNDTKPLSEMTPRERSNANLKPFRAGADDWRTPEQKREMARKSHATQLENRRRRKKLTAATKWLLEADHIATTEEIVEKLKKLHIEDATNAEALAVAAMVKALKGDVDAMRFVRDTGGEAPSNKVELAGDIDRPIATMDLRNMSEEDLMRLAEARADDSDDPVPDE